MLKLGHRFTYATLFLLFLVGTGTVGVVLLNPTPRQIAWMLISELYFGGFSSLSDNIDFARYFVAEMDKMRFDGSLVTVAAPTEPSLPFEDRLISAVHRGEWRNNAIALPTSIHERDALWWQTYKVLSLLQGGTAKSDLPNAAFYSDPRTVWLLDLEQLLTTSDPYSSKLSLSGVMSPPYSSLQYRPDLLPQSPIAGKGISVEDFDNDSFLDLVIANSYGSPVYLRNDRGQGFLDITTGSGLETATQAYSISNADVNNDGWVDLFFARPFHHYQLYLNQGNGRFRDITADSGLIKGSQSEFFYGTWITSWSDIDNDSDMDLFVSQWGEPFIGTSGFLSKKTLPSTLFINETHGGNIRFREGTAEAGLTDIVVNQTIVASNFADLNGDRQPDLLLSKFSRDGLIVLLNHNGRFQRDQRILSRKPGFTVSALDFDNDGSTDILQGGHGQARSIFAAALAKMPHIDSQSRILRQNNSRRYQEVPISKEPTAFNTLGISYGDLNQDNCPDISIGTGNPEPWFLSPNYLFISESAPGISVGAPIDCRLPRTRFSLDLPLPLQFVKMQGNVLADLDRDGDLDLVAACGGFWPGEVCSPLLFKNELASNNWIAVRLRGTKSNHRGIGASVSFTAVKGKLKVANLMHQMGTLSGFGSGPAVIHAVVPESIDQIEATVSWPSGIKTKHLLETNRYSLLEESGLTVQ